MAGFLGWVRLDGERARFSDAIASLCHLPSFRGEMLAGDGMRGVAVVYREVDPPDVIRIPERELVVAVLGSVLQYTGGRWHLFSALELADRYLVGGIVDISGLDGFYQIVVWDGRAQQLHVLNDRVGSMPFHLARVDGGVAFAPEAKALFRLLPIIPRLDLTAATSFLNIGYVIGTRTLFAGVRLLAPAQRLTLNLRSGEEAQQRTWVQCFERAPRLGLRAAAGLLYEAIMTAARAPFHRGGAPTWIGMTGGYDSRVLLHALNEMGCRPDLAVTWGATDSEPNSDPPVAKALAEALGLTHRFYRYDAESVTSHATIWGVISEFASDNLGYFAAGPTLLCERGVPCAGGIYIGDVVIASGGLPRTIEDAVTTVLPCQYERLQQPLESVLRPGQVDAHSAAFWTEVQQVVDGCPTSLPEAVQDYLWGAVYNFRWLFSPGFYKEPMLTAWRPMLLGPTYDALTRIPARLRVYRRVLVEMVHRHLPPAFRRPRADASSLVDWQYESRHEPTLRHFLQAHTSWDALAATPLAEVIHKKAVENLVATFFAEQPLPMRRQARRRMLFSLRRRLAAAPLMAGALRMGQRLLSGRPGLPESRRLDATRLLWRIALLVSMHELIAAEAFTGEVARAPKAE